MSNEEKLAIYLRAKVAYKDEIILMEVRGRAGKKQYATASVNGVVTIMPMITLNIDISVKQFLIDYNIVNVFVGQDDSLLEGVG